MDGGRDGKDTQLHLTEIKMWSDTKKFIILYISKEIYAQIDIYLLHDFSKLLKINLNCAVAGK